MFCGKAEQIQPQVVIKTCPDQSILAPPHPDVKHDPFTGRHEMQQLLWRTLGVLTWEQ